MYDRFSLEDDIMSMTQISSDIELIVNAMMEDQITMEEASQALVGISCLHVIKTNNLFDCFRRVFELDEYNPDNDQETSDK